MGPTSTYERTSYSDSDIGRLLLASAERADSALMPLAEFTEWFAARGAAQRFEVSRIPFDDLSGWSFHPDTGNLSHASGRFFAIEGLRVQTDRSWIRHWTQPIIVQPEIGMLGILVKEFDGVLHCLMQAKMEPGNVNGVQLSPTVQATRSNYTGVHGGSSIKYLEYFADTARAATLVDVLQSEQGAWFLHKRNRNIVVATEEDVPLDEDFCWLTLGQIRQLLKRDHVINMDARTVLSCISPMIGAGADGQSRDSGSFGDAVRQSLYGDVVPRSHTREVLSWLTEVRARRELVQRRVPLDAVTRDGWYREDAEIAHRDGKYFKVIAADVRASSREVGSWTQPLVAPIEPGLLALVVRRIDGVLHALVQARVDAGALIVAELAPTVHCQPGNYRDVPETERPDFLGTVLTASESRIRYDVMHSEEGGRFYRAQNRYLIIEVAEDFPLDVPENYHWTTLRQLTDMLLHTNYLNVELRTLITSVQAL